MDVCLLKRWGNMSTFHSWSRGGYFTVTVLCWTYSFFPYSSHLYKSSDPSPILYCLEHLSIHIKESFQTASGRGFFSLTPTLSPRGSCLCVGECSLAQVLHTSVRTCKRCQRSINMTMKRRLRWSIPGSQSGVCFCLTKWIFFLQFTLLTLLHQESNNSQILCSFSLNVNINPSLSACCLCCYNLFVPPLCSVTFSMWLAQLLKSSSPFHLCRSLNCIAGSKGKLCECCLWHG